MSEIVTPLCVFTMYQGQLILKSVHPYTTIDEVAENTAFPIRYFSIETTPPPTAEEMRALGEIDPLDLAKHRVSLTAAQNRHQKGTFYRERKSCICPVTTPIFS